MKHLQRRILYSLAIIIFLSLAPAIALYAGGYRFDYRFFRLTKVGAFYIRSTPDKAFIEIDGKIINRKTPTRLLNIQPGNHELSVYLSDSQPWKKTLAVVPGATTFINDVILFKSKPESEKLSNGGTVAKRSDDGSLYMHASSTDFILTNTTNGRAYEIRASTKNIRVLAISSRNHQAVVAVNASLNILDLDTERLVPIPLFQQAAVQKVLWDARGQEVVWVLENGTVYAYNIVSRTRQAYETAASDFYLLRNDLYTLTRAHGNDTVRRRNLDTDESSILIILTSPLERLLLRITDDYVALNGEKTLRIINNNSPETPVVIDSIRSEWLNDRWVLVASAHELSVYDTKNRRTEFIDRTSRPITSIQWHPSGLYVARALDSEIQIIELDSRDVRNMISIPLTEPVASFYFSQQGDYLHIISPSENRRVAIE